MFAPTDPPAMVAKSIRLLICLIAFLPADRGWSQPAPEVEPLPRSLVVDGKSYDVVTRESRPDEFLRLPPQALRFQDHKPTEVLGESLRYWLDGCQFVRSPDGKFALPFHGDAPFVGYIDLDQKSFVSFKDAFPPTGEQLGKSWPPRYHWVSLLDEGPQPQGMWLFVSLWNRETLKSASWRVRVSLAAPGQIQVAAMDNVAVLEILARNGKEFLAHIAENHTWARISTDTGKVLAIGKPTDDNAHLGRAAYAPDQREIYASYSSGLAIFNAEDGRELSRSGVGKFANAFSLGATFDPDGKVAAIATPYASEITLLDVKSHQLIKRYQSKVPLAGIVFDAKESKAYAIITSLPYE